MIPKLQETLNILMADDLKAQREQGLSQGISQGAERVSALIGRLLKENRSSDLERIAAAPDYRDMLLREYGL